MYGPKAMNDQVQQHVWCCSRTRSQEEQIKNLAGEQLSACPCLSCTSQSMPMQHMLPTVPRNGTAYIIPAPVCKERGNGAVPPFQLPYHITKESLMSRNLWNSLPPV